MTNEEFIDWLRSTIPECDPAAHEGDAYHEGYCDAVRKVSDKLRILDKRS